MHCLPKLTSALLCLIVTVCQLWLRSKLVPAAEIRLRTSEAVGLQMTMKDAGEYVFRQDCALAASTFLLAMRICRV